MGSRLKELGYEVMSVDNAPWTKATSHFDILSWDYKQYPIGYFDVIAASPPCNIYSTAYNFRPRDFAKADALVEKALEIINFFQPRLWWLENPRTGFLKGREIVKNLPFIDIDYCQFSDWGYKKPTRFWCCPEMAKLPVMSSHARILSHGTGVSSSTGNCSEGGK